MGDKGVERVQDLCVLCWKTGTGWFSSAGIAGGCSALRRHFCGLLMLLVLCCSGLYLLLYYRATLAMPSLILQRVQSLRSHVVSSLRSSEVDDYLPISGQPGDGPALNSRWNASEMASIHSLRKAINSGSVPPLLTLFTSWSEKDELALVRNITLRNWAQLKPFIVPVVFTNSSALAAEARTSGWDVMPVSRASVGMPILKNMYLDAMAKYNSTLYAFANGDLLFTKSLVSTLLTVLTAWHLPLDTSPLLIVGLRTNVQNVTSSESATFDDITQTALTRGKAFIKMAEDYFIADK